MLNKFLIRNRIIFDHLLTQILQDDKKYTYEYLQLGKISKLSEFVWRNHPGFLFNYDLENYLMELGSYVDKIPTSDSSLIKELKAKVNNIKKPVILHVVTELADYGGHTRIQTQMINRIPTDYFQILVILNQDENNYPIILTKLKKANLLIISLNFCKDPFKKSATLRQIAKKAKIIFLNHHPYDYIPILAFSTKLNSPVLTHNHAHSWFWLGAGITDILLSYDPFHKEYNDLKRNCKYSYLLKASQIDPIKNQISFDKTFAKKKLGLDSNCNIILSVGTEEKFVPNNRYNFFKIAQKILNKYENLKIIVIGVNPNFKYIPNNFKKNSRILFIKYVADIQNFYEAADIFIEPMPQPSLGSTMYSIIEGLACPIFNYGKKGIFSSENLIDTESYYKILKKANNSDEYLQNLDILINNPEIRIQIAHSIRSSLISTYEGQFEESIKELLEFAKNKRHEFYIIDHPREIDGSDLDLAEGSLFRSMKEIFKFFDTYLTMRDKFAISLKCLLKRVHVYENIEIICHLIIERFNFNKFLSHVKY